MRICEVNNKHTPMKKIYIYTPIKVTRENSGHLTTQPLVSPPNDVWETSTEILYWWRITIQIWVVLLTGWIKFPTWHDQSEALPRSGYWRVISMEFLRSFLRRHLAGKPVVESQNVGCFLRLKWRKTFLISISWTNVQSYNC